MTEWLSSCKTSLFELSTNMVAHSHNEQVLDKNKGGTRQFIDKTTHRHGFWRQFIDTIEDNPSTLFEDNSSTHYYLAIIPKLIKWRQCFSIKVIYYHVYDQNNEFRILIPYLWFLIQFQIPFKPHTTTGANKLTHCILKCMIYMELFENLLK